MPLGLDYAVPQGLKMFIGATGKAQWKLLHGWALQGR